MIQNQNQKSVLWKWL